MSWARKHFDGLNLANAQDSELLNRQLITCNHLDDDVVVLSDGLSQNHSKTLGYRGRVSLREDLATGINWVNHRGLEILVDEDESGDLRFETWKSLRFK